MRNRIGLFMFALSVTLLLLPTPADAGSYRVGYMDQNNYVFNSNGRWERGGHEYYRTAYEAPGYWKCGAYYPGSVSYSYELYIAPTYVAPPVVPAYTEGSWKQDLLKYARQKQDFQEYLEAVKLLGLAQPQPAYNPYGLHGNYYQQTVTGYGANANTLYQYSQQPQQLLLTREDIILLSQMQNQSGNQALALASNVQAGISSNLRASIDGNVEIARVVAKRDFAIAVLQSLNGPNSITNQGFEFKIGPDKGVNMDSSKATPEAKARIKTLWETSAKTNCASCHSGPKASGGFDVAEFPTMSQENQDVVLSRLLSADDKVRMPRDKEHPELPGKALGNAEMQVWIARSRLKE